MPQPVVLLCGIDVGGTFTDFVAFAGGLVRTLKVPTTPDDPSRAIMSGIAELAKLVDRDGSVTVIHGTTLPANLVIERKGAPTGLLTTDGFADLIDFRRESRYEIFDLFLEFPQPLVPADRRWGVRERTGASGAIEEELEAVGVLALVEQLRASGTKSVAIVFLNSPANGHNERAARDILSREAPELYTSLSCEVAPVIREYERLSTTMINAYLQPLVDGYLGSLERKLLAIWPRLQLRLMVSNGGIASATVARRLPVRLLESGPAAGSFAAAHYARRAGVPHALAFDMGGTTAKLGIVQGGSPSMTSMFEVDRVSRFKKGSGLPVRARAIDLLEIGAGGGSIAAIDDLGLLNVGPESAGAQPGPACYGRGGDRPTVTDADLLVGYLSAEHFLGGAMQLSTDLAERAVRPVAERLGISLDEASWAIHDLVNENMATAARLHAAEKGLDPRSFALVATGGAGPVHACHVATKLGISHVLIPSKAGVASAFGLLLAPPRMDAERSNPMLLAEPNLLHVNRALEEPEAGIKADLRPLVGEHPLAIRRELDLRYEGQRSEVDVQIPAGALRVEHLPAIRRLFEERYATLYGRTPEDPPEIEVVTTRVIGTGPDRDLRWLGEEPAADSAASGVRCVYLARRVWSQVPVLPRSQLRSGSTGSGPAIIEEDETTTVVEEGWSYEIGNDHLLHLRRR